MHDALESDKSVDLGTDVTRLIFFLLRLGDDDLLKEGPVK